MRIPCAIFAVLLYSCAGPMYTSNDRFMLPEIQDGNELSEGLSGISSDETYGYTTSNPVQVGGGPANEREYLSMLLGPNGEEIQFVRIGSFGGFEVPIDGYECSYKGADSSIVIYIDMYTYKDPKAPAGLLIKENFKLQIIPDM